jgi:hypothetical protein
MEDMAAITEMICRYAVFEDVYIQSVITSDDELKRCLVRLYAAILVYLSNARKYFEQNLASGYASLPYITN